MRARTTTGTTLRIVAGSFAFVVVATLGACSSSSVCRSGFCPAPRASNTPASKLAVIGPVNVSRTILSHGG